VGYHKDENWKIRNNRLNYVNKESGFIDIPFPKACWESHDLVLSKE